MPALRASRTTTPSTTRMRWNWRAASFRTSTGKRRLALRVRERREPLYEVAELHSVVPTDARKPFDVREVIARIVDGSELDEFKPLYGTTLACGFAHIFGYPVGVVSNNGI